MLRGEVTPAAHNEWEAGVNNTSPPKGGKK